VSDGNDSGSLRDSLLLDRLPAMGALTTCDDRCSIKKGTLPGNTSEKD